MATIYQKLGQKVRLTRRKMGLSQEKLAEMVGMSTRTITAIEQGTSNLKLKTLHKLVKALKSHSSKLLPF